MRLYLIQHGPAATKDVDPDRPLTEEGAAAVRRVASFLEPRRARADILWHSGKTRARETAAIVAAAFGGIDPIAREGLAPGDDVEPIEAEIAHRAGEVVIVGHLPFLSRLASLLLAGDPEAGTVAFTPGGVVCLERSDGTPSWSIAWAVTPDLVA